jgi:hypothetical protein
MKHEDCGGEVLIQDELNACSLGICKKCRKSIMIMRESWIASHETATPITERITP